MIGVGEGILGIWGSWGYSGEKRQTVGLGMGGQEVGERRKAPISPSRGTERSRPHTEEAEGPKFKPRADNAM